MKKICFIALFVIVFTISLSALGTLRVEYIKELPTTHMNLEVRDADGKWAPVLIVKTELKGLGFKNIGRPTKHAPEYSSGDHHYKFYMNDNQRVVKITHSDYEPLEVRLLADFRIEVKVQRVYEMVLSNIPEKIYIPINIVTEPIGARIYIDGNDKGINETQKVFIGKHKIRIHKKGYKPITDEIEVTENKTLFKYTLTEIEDIPIMIYSEPEGATVYIDNIKMGETPLASFYTEGKYKIKIEKGLYEIIEDQIIIKLPIIEKRFILEPIYATLNIVTFPNATVYLNETKLDSMHNLHLEPMLINLRVTMPKAEPLEKRIILKKNEIRTIDLFPNVKTGTIQVGIIPEDATIDLSGDGGEYYTANEISNFKDIPIGKYELKVSKEGYRISKEVIILKEGKKIKKQIILEIGTDYSDMVFVKGGTFQMGSSLEFHDAKPVHTVTVDDFYIGKHEVTQKEWKEIMGNDYSIFIYFIRDNLPVEGTSWYDAVEYCNTKSEIEGFTPCYTVSDNDIKCNFTANGYRLPTEAEWEYAARGGDKSRYYKYSGSDKIDEVAWLWKNSGDTKLIHEDEWYYFNNDKIDKNNCKIHSIGLKLPNELGIYDMSGNIAEWCNDVYEIGVNYYKNSPRNNPKGPEPDTSTWRINRGGDFSRPTHLCHVASRNATFYDTHSPQIGFRLCRSAGFDVKKVVEVKKNTFLSLLNKYLVFMISLVFIVISLSVVLLILRKRRSRNKNV